MYKKLEEMLVKRGLSAADLCKATGIPQSTISNLKSRDGNLSVKNLVKVAQYLEIPVDELMEE